MIAIDNVNKWKLIFYSQLVKWLCEKFDFVMNCEKIYFMMFKNWILEIFRDFDESNFGEIRYPSLLYEEK